MQRKPKSNQTPWKAEYIGSYINMDKLPAKSLPIIAVIGRSNVGKSSFINAVTGIKDLARVSAQPGKTQTLNYYNVNNQFYLVDMPGFGYAKVSKTLREQWSHMITDYLSKVEKLYSLFILIDGNLPPQDVDIHFIEWCGENQIPILIIRTKIDKSKPNQLASNLNALKDKLLETWEELPGIFNHSAVNKSGNEEIRKFLNNLGK